MNKETEPFADEDELVEIEWDALQGAVDAFADAELDFTDNPGLADHLSALMACLLRKIGGDGNLDDQQLAESAAEIAAFAVDLALSGDELPDFAPSDEGDEN